VPGFESRVNSDPKKIFGFGHSSRQGAKTLSSEEKNNDPQTSSILIVQPFRLCGLAEDNPISSFAYFAFFAVNFSGSECLVAG
jgi:hypothetical protein